MDNTIILPASVYSDLADGTFQVYGDNIGLTVWGSNRSLLTITSVPEPSATMLLGIAFVGATSTRRNRRRAKAIG